MRVNVGDIVLAKYLDFDLDIQTAMFVVCYHESYDVRTSSNFTAIKISSNEGCYQIPLLKEYLPFLNHDSFLNCSTMFRFREDQVLKRVGELTPYYLNKMLQQTSNYYRRMSKQITEAIGDHNMFKDFSTPQKVIEIGDEDNE